MGDRVVFVKRLLDSLAAPTLAAARLGIGTALLLAFVAVSGRWSELASLGTAEWGWALLTGLLLAGYVATWYAALARAQAVDVTAVLVLAAVVTALLDRGIEGTPVDLVGVGLVAAGGALAALLTFDPLPGRRRRELGRAPLRALRLPAQRLGYCGADQNRTLLEYGDAGASDQGLVELARSFEEPGRTSS